jgi:hypothetical protein
MRVLASDDSRICEAYYNGVVTPDVLPWALVVLYVINRVLIYVWGQ